MKTEQLFIRSHAHFDPDANPKIFDSDLEIKIDTCGYISISDRACISDMASTKLVRVREEQMRIMTNGLPTEDDMAQTDIEIQNLCEQETALLPALQASFHDLMKSAQKQLKDIYQELADPRMKIVSRSIELKKLILKHWGKLSATLVMAESYCPKPVRISSKRRD